MKKRTLNSEIESVVIQLLNDDNINYKIIREKNKLFLETDLSSSVYHNYILKAMCLKQQNNKKTPVVSYNEILKRKPSSSYITLEKDKNKILSLN